MPRMDERTRTLLTVMRADTSNLRAWLGLAEREAAMYFPDRVYVGEFVGAFPRAVEQGLVVPCDTCDRLRLGPGGMHGVPAFVADAVARFYPRTAPYQLSITDGFLYVNRVRRERPPREDGPWLTRLRAWEAAASWTEDAPEVVDAGAR